jgi:hypothetical protein
MIKIYRIVDNTNGNIYIGKTKGQLNQRLWEHKGDFNRGKYCSSQEILKNGDYKIELIEETHDENRERYWIINTECVNKIIPGRTRKEHYQDNKNLFIKYNKKYYENNKDILKEKKKNIYNYRKSFGGDERRDNNLLKIDTNLFFY